MTKMLALLATVAATAVFANPEAGTTSGAAAAANSGEAQNKSAVEGVAPGATDADHKKIEEDKKKEDKKHDKK